MRAGNPAPGLAFAPGAASERLWAGSPHVSAPAQQPPALPVTVQYVPGARPSVRDGAAEHRRRGFLIETQDADALDGGGVDGAGPAFSALRPGRADGIPLLFPSCSNAAHRSESARACGRTATVEKTAATMKQMGRSFVVSPGRFYAVN